MNFCDCDILKKRILNHKQYPNQKKMQIKDILHIIDGSIIMFGHEMCACRDCHNWDRSWYPRMSMDYHYCIRLDQATKDTFYCGYSESR